MTTTNQQTIDFQRGDVVTVEGMDGDDTRAAVLGVAEELAGEYEIPTRNGTRTLEEYWRGHGIDADERVIEVRYVKGVDLNGEPKTYSQTVYGMPESQVVGDG